MKYFFLAFLVVSLLVFALPQTYSVSINANVEPVRYFTPTTWFLISNRTGLQARDCELGVTSDYVADVTVTIANTGTSSYSYFLIIVAVYNTSGGLVAWGYDIFFSFFNPLSPGETYTTTISLNTAVPVNETAYVVVQIR